MISKIYNRYLDSFRGLSREVWLLAFLMLINRSGAMVIPFLSVYLTQRLDFTLSQTGWVMGFFGLGSLIGTYIGGYLTDKIGYYSVQLWSLLLTGVMFFILQTIDSFILFNITIFITSTISDAFRPANMTAVAHFSEPKDRTRSISLIRLSINAGWAVGPAIGGIIAISLGYHWLFWLDGTTCILAGIFLLLFLSPKKEIDPDPEESVSEPIRLNLFKDKEFIWFLFLNVLSMLVFFQIFTTIPVYYKSALSLNEDSIGLIMALNGLLIALLEMPIVFSLENRHSPLRIIIFGTILISLAFLVFNFGSWPGLAIISMLLLTFGEIYHMPFSNSFTMARSGKAELGRYLSYYGMSFSLAFILAPVVGMFLADNYGYIFLWNVMTGIGLLAAIGYFLLYRKSVAKS